MSCQAVCATRPLTHGVPGPAPRPAWTSAVSLSLYIRAATSGGNPPLATGPQRSISTSIRHLP